MWGVPAAGLAAPATAIVEIVAGAALIAGLYTRVAATLLGIVMIGALLYIKTDIGVIATANDAMPGAELDLGLLAGLVALMATGTGRLSVDAAAGLDPPTVAVEERAMAAV
jgi:putative oxidoreductase